MDLLPLSNSNSQEPDIRRAAGNLKGKRFDAGAIKNWMQAQLMRRRQIIEGRELVPDAGAATIPSAPSATNAGGAIAAKGVVEEIVENTFSGKFEGDGSTLMQRYGDANFYLPTLAEVAVVLKESQLDRFTWIADRFDCDDFSYVLKGEFSRHAYNPTQAEHQGGDITKSLGFAFGIIWGIFDWVAGFHAVNFVVLDTMEILLIEPQHDDIYTADRCQRGVNLIVI